MTTKDSVPELADSSNEPKKLNNAARIFLQRAREYDEMIQEAQSEYRIGMRHLANMMGADPESFTQKDADVSTRYTTVNFKIFFDL